MNENRLFFLKNTFSQFELQFADDFSNVVIMNPNYNENITVYDDGYEFVACFSFQHRHFEDQNDLTKWIGEIISGIHLQLNFSIMNSAVLAVRLTKTNCEDCPMKSWGN